MNRLERRLERLEHQSGAKPRARLIYLMPNLEEGEGEETPYAVRLSSEVWAHAFGGGRFTVEEIRRLKEEYSEPRK